jgi:hypothetical protein
MRLRMGFVFFLADFFLILERAEDDEESRQSKGRSSSIVVVVRTTRVTHKDVSFARTREAGRARGCHSERRRRVASGPGRRTKRKKLEKSSLIARVGRRVGEPKTFFGSRARVRGRRKRASRAGTPRHQHASGR